jgi:uncharacterized RDD family membrane protein YckC
MRDTVENPFAPPGERADVPPEQATRDAVNLATYQQRLAGAIIDGLLSAATAMPGLLLYVFVLREQWSASMPSPPNASDAFRVVMQGVALVSVGPLVLGSYQWWLITKTGQSLAKRWLGTRIAREESGDIPGFVRGVLLRTWLFTAAGLIPYAGSFVALADAIAIFVGGRRQTLHDRAARTIVIVASMGIR